MADQDDKSIFMEQLGIEPFQLLFQVFNFALMVVLLTKFLYKPILKVLEERRKKIAEGLEYAQKMQEEKNKNEKKLDEILNKAREEVRKIIQEGKDAGKRLEAEIIEKAQKEASAIMEKERKELEMERSEMEKELKFQTVKIAGNWVEAVLGKLLDTKKQQEIINKNLQELERTLK